MWWEKQLAEGGGLAGCGPARGRRHAAVEARREPGAGGRRRAGLAAGGARAWQPAHPWSPRGLGRWRRSGRRWRRRPSGGGGDESRARARPGWSRSVRQILRVQLNPHLHGIFLLGWLQPSPTPIQTPQKRVEPNQVEPSTPTKHTVRAGFDRGGTRNLKILFPGSGFVAWQEHSPPHMHGLRDTTVTVPA